MAVESRLYNCLRTHNTILFGFLIIYHEVKRSLAYRVLYLAVNVFDGRKYHYYEIWDESLDMTMMSIFHWAIFIINCTELTH